MSAYLVGEFEFSSSNGRENVDYIGVVFVEISNISAMPGDIIIGNIIT